MIHKTARQPGKINPTEVMLFQKRYDLQVDGKFGTQSLGQVFEIERAYEVLRLEPKPKCTLWAALAGTVALVAAWLIGLFA